MFESGEDDETKCGETKQSVELPYTANHRIVIFGGHESWRKVIQDMLLEVRFVDASTVPNESLIKNADFVFIQTNAISHSSFYKIAETTRKRGIPMKCFKYASAEKCAKQLAEFDMNYQDSSN